jgi:ATP-binding cassette subfamily F protein uup
MDKVVDHLLVFKGDGEIKDFPGNYTQYRSFSSERLESKGERNVNAQHNQKTSQKDNATASQSSPLTSKKKLSYKEKRELEQLEKDIAALEDEQRQIEEALCGGTTSVEEITAMSKRLPVLKDELDEKSMRWLELSEMDN